MQSMSNINRSFAEEDAMRSRTMEMAMFERQSLGGVSVGAPEEEPTPTDPSKEIEPPEPLEPDIPTPTVPHPSAPHDPAPPYSRAT